MLSRNHALHTLFLANGIFVFAGITISPLYALFADSLHASILTISALTSTLFVAKIVGTIIIYLLGDNHYNKKHWLILGYLLRTLGWGLLPFTSSIHWLFVSQAIIGLSEGIGSPSFRSLVATNIDDGHEMSEYASWELILAVTGVTGALAGGVIVTQFGFAALFVIISTLALLSALVATRYVPRP